MVGAMRFFRKRSKRTSTRQRVKQEKKLREHNRKLRKEKKKNPDKFRKSKKDPGVPNCPFREEVMQEISEAKKRKEEERIKRREKLKESKADRKSGTSTTAESKLAAVPDFIFPEAELLQAPHEPESDSDSFSFCEASQLVAESDIVIEVLDARDPLSSRIARVSKLCSDQNKRLIFLLNRADLVPKNITKAWIKYLRMQHPAIAFKSGTELTSKCIGHSTLLSTLKSLNPRNENLTLGFVGYPGVGKRSVISSLQGNLTKKFAIGNVIGLALDARKGSVYGKECLADLKDPCHIFSQYVFPRFPRASWLTKYNQVNPGDSPRDVARWAEKDLGVQKVISKYLTDYREGNLSYYARPSGGSRVKPTDEFGDDFTQLPDVLEAESIELLPNPVLDKKRAQKETAVHGSSEESEDSEDDDQAAKSETEDAPSDVQKASGRGLKRKEAGAESRSKRKRKT